MRELFSAERFRLWGSRLFYILAAILAAVEIYVCVDQYHWQDVTEDPVMLDNLFLGCSLLCGMALAVFISLFLGAEHADGTLRNKLVAGHTRGQVYLSSFAVCALAGLLFEVVYAVVPCAVGIPLFGGLRRDAAVMVPLVLDTVLLAGVFAAFFTALTVNIPNKAVNAVICLVAAVVFLLVGMILTDRLNAPEFISSGFSITMDGVTVGEDIPNPQYLSPGQKTIVDFILDLLPAGQAYRLCASAVTHPWRMVILSAAETFVFSLGGYAIFRKKDLR